MFADVFLYLLHAVGGFMIPLLKWWV